MTETNATRPPRLIIEGVVERGMGGWSAGYEHAGSLRVFAGGVARKTLRQLIDSERRRFPDLEVEDRRR